MGHQRCRCNQHLYCPMASIPPKAGKSLLRRISHRRWIRHVCLPLQTKRRSHRCHGNHPYQPKISIFGQFTCHPQWNSNMMDYDYSILTLSSQVDVTDPDVAIIPIAAKEYPGGMDAIITGWGMTNPNINRPPTQLQLAETNLVSAEDCKASEETASTADAWETLAVHLSSLTQMMVSPTWLETPPSEPQTAPPPPQECGPRTLLSRIGSTASSLPNFSLFQTLIFLYHS